MKNNNPSVAIAIILLLFAIVILAYYLPNPNIQKTTTITTVTTVTTVTYGSAIAYYPGQKASNFLIKQINANNVTGISYILYPVAALNGTPKTLYIGNTVGYNCDGSLKMLTSINSSYVIFTNVSTGTRPGGCPI